MTKAPNPFRWFDSSPEVIRLVVMMYVRYPLSLRNVEDLLFERGIDICHETVRLWWNRFGPMFAGEIRRKRAHNMRAHAHWRWHLDEVYVKINGEMRYLWRSWLKWLWTVPWTAANFWRVFILRNRSIARSRRRNGRWEFSTRLFIQRHVSWSWAAPISFRAAPYDRNPSVTMAFGRPCRFMAFLMNFNAAALSLVVVTKDSSTSPS